VIADEDPSDVEVPLCAGPPAHDDGVALFVVVSDVPDVVVVVVIVVRDELVPSIFE